ncbi:MAG: hypothetical protein ACOX5I_02820 [Gleimia sp.]|jgi:hypothetical protein
MRNVKSFFHFGGKLVMIGVCAGALVMSLSSCSNAEPDASNRESVPATSSAENNGNGPKLGELQGSGEGSASSQVVPITDTYTFSDGLSFSVDDPVPLDNVSGGGEAIELDISIDNQTSEVFSTADITISIISEGELATILGYGTAEPITLPDNPIGSGQNTGMKLGCEVKNSDDLRIMFTFGDGRGDLTFVSD